MVLAVVPNLAVVEGLNITVVASASSEVGVLGVEGLNGVVLLVSDAERALHDEVLDSLRARRNGERAEVGEELSVERLSELAETNLALDVGGAGGVGGSVGPVDALKEGVGEATSGLLVPHDDDGGEVVETGRALLLVDDVGLHHVATVLGGFSVDGVLRGSMEVDLLNVVLLAIARVATTDGNEAEVTLDLERMTVVLEGHVLTMLVVEVETERLSIGLTSAHTGGGRGVDVDRGLSLTSGTQTRPVGTTLGVVPSDGRSRIVGGGGGRRSSAGAHEGHDTSKDDKGQLHFCS
jgi:hypothetical protein